MIDNLIASDGLITSLGGILVVFSGLILIALVIFLFNLIFSNQHNPDRETTGKNIFFSFFSNVAKKQAPADIPADELAAIAAAIELYRRLHFDAMDSAVTFERGLIHDGWKLGVRYGQRSNPRR